MLALVSVLLAGPVLALSLNLTVSITTTGLLDGNGDPLPNNSLVYVILTDDPASPPPDPASFGNALIGNSVQPNELLLGEIRLNWDGLPPFLQIPDGGFSSQQMGSFNFGLYTHAYLRFFDYDGASPVSGSNIAWGTVGPVAISNQGFGVASVTFEGTNVFRTNNFVVIPEPGTFALLFMAGTLLVLTYSSGFGRRLREQAGSEGSQNL